MSNNLLAVAYVAASLILSLASLSNQATARKGNLYGIAGMLIAFTATACKASSVTEYAHTKQGSPGAVIGAVVSCANSAGTGGNSAQLCGCCCSFGRHRQLPGSRANR